MATKKGLKIESAPRRMSGEPLYPQNYLNRFSKIAVEVGDKTYAFAGKELPKNQRKRLGTAIETFLGCLVMASLSGRGDAPDGAAVWATRVAQKNGETIKKLGQYTLIIEGGRGGGYVASVADMLAIARAKAQIAVESAKRFPRQAARRATAIDSGDEEVDIELI